MELLPFSLVSFFVFSYTLTSSSQHQTYVVFGADHSNWRVNYRLLELHIPQFLIPSRHPAPTSTFIPIPSAKVHVAPTHRLHCCKSHILQHKDQNVHISRSKRVALCIFKFCDSLITSHLAVLSCIAPSKWGLSQCCPCIFIPHPGFKISLIPHPASTLILILHPANPMADHEKTLHFHFILNCYHPMYFRT